MVKDWPRPKSVKEVRSFLGLCSYYWKFVKGFAIIANLYINLLRKTKNFMVGGLSKRFWESNKNSLNLRTYIGVLRRWRRSDIRHQVAWGKEQSWKGYSILQQNTVSARTTVLCNTARTTGTCGCSETVSHVYLWPQGDCEDGSHWLLNFKSPEGQMVHWLGDLGRYDLDIQYQPGKAHGNADALSRRPCGDCKHCKEQEEHDQSEDTADCPAGVCAIYAIHKSLKHHG